MNVASIGVIGAGQMGNGIAHVMALAGYDVRLTDVSEDALAGARAIIEGNMNRQVAREKISEADRDAALARIAPVRGLADLGSTDLVIEAATERETIKTAIFEDILPHLKPDTILTS
ncbi:MAG: 3-hydroxyacyl-CoA dehydrogenase NAD-binding domain-containing protein, partial [Pseudomonadota bacterium]